MRKFIFVAIAAMLSVSAFSQSGKDHGVFKNAIYARFGYGFPGGELKTKNIITAVGQFEVGTFFYFQSLNLPEKLKLGIDVNYLSVAGMMNRDTMKADNKSDSYFTAGVKVGPCISYNPAGSLIVDAFFKIYPHKFIMGESKYGHYKAANQVQFGTSFGLNLRYKMIMLGCEFSSAKYDFEIPDPKSSALPQATMAQKVKLPVSIVSLGVNF